MGNGFVNRLLVVDDEPSLGRLVKRVAESVGYDVVVTEDPTVFTRTARHWQPSVIMLDLNIAGTDGSQLLRSLAADKCEAHVLLTSGVDGRTLIAAQQLGIEYGLNMGNMLQKPVRPETLRELLFEFKPISKALLANEPAK